MKFKLNKDRLTTEGVLLKRGVIKNFAEFTGKHLCQSLFSNKFAALGNNLKHHIPHYIKKRKFEASLYNQDNCGAIFHNEFSLIL